MRLAEISDMTGVPRWRVKFEDDGRTFTAYQNTRGFNYTTWEARGSFTTLADALRAIASRFDEQNS